MLQRCQGEWQTTVTQIGMTLKQTQKITVYQTKNLQEKNFSMETSIEEWNFNL